jgi:ABC-type dipeptide/oligopeptide/nickel transport system ATPase component
MIGPSGSGKTTIVKSFVALKNTKEALLEKRIPVLHVTLKAPATRKSFAQDILIAIQDFGYATDPNRGTENALQERVRIYLEELKVELVIIDEFHHLVLSKNEHVAYIVSEMIKWMLIKGVCPIVMSGTDDARKPFRANPQLVRRAIPAVDLSPLSIYSAFDKALFTDFLGYFLDAMERQGVLKNAMSLLNGDIPACLFEISGGVLGLVCKVLEDAVRLMTHAERPELKRDDLVRAADEFKRDKKCDSNPFVDGLKPMRLAA